MNGFSVSRDEKEGILGQEKNEAEAGEDQFQGLWPSKLGAV